MLRVALIGAGRMGRALVREIAAAPDLQLTGVCVRETGTRSAKEFEQATGVAANTTLLSGASAVVEPADVVIDFSSPGATKAVVAAAVRAGKPLLCGVTGLDVTAWEAVRGASAHIPLFYDQNMSTGIAVMQELVQLAARALGSNFAALVSETHHRFKVDAPSGTALKLGEGLARARGEDFRSVYHFDPEGAGPEPARAAIVFEASRHGDNPGEHSVRFATDNESLTLMHKVTNRQVFASGALRAARWLANQPVGLYNTSNIIA
jgi:4-hydroxy-tetrahydrodipicolinate reductase